MTKKFTKGCAVDVRGMPEVMFETIKRVGDGHDDGLCAQFKNICTFKYLALDQSDYCFDDRMECRYILTPTEILGERLVKAIEEGYKPYFKDDSTNLKGFDLRFDSYGKVIAYKPIDQPPIESTILSAKVNQHNHYFKDVSHLETVDVYRVINLFNVTDPCHQHAIKKILCCGQRGAKDAAKDTQEAIDSLKRALEMMREYDGRTTVTE